MAMKRSPGPMCWLLSHAAGKTCSRSAGFVLCRRTCSPQPCSISLRVNIPCILRLILWYIAFFAGQIISYAYPRGRNNSCPACRVPGRFLHATCGRIFGTPGTGASMQNAGRGETVETVGALETGLPARVYLFFAEEKPLGQLRHLR